MSQTQIINPRSLEMDMHRLGRRIREMAVEKPVKVKISEDKETRRDKQNKLMWRWHNEFVKHRYEVAGELFTPEQWHEAFKPQFIGTADPVKINGEWVIASRSTKDLSVKEFAEMLTKYQAEAAQDGCQLTSSDDLYWAAVMRSAA